MAILSDLSEKNFIWHTTDLKMAVTNLSKSE